MSAISSAAMELESRAVLRQSFVWMTIGLIITSITAWLGSQSDFITQLVTTQPVAAVVSLIAWLVLAIGFPWFVRRVPYPVGIVLFAIYSALGGLSLSSIFMAYTNATIVYALVSTVALFAVITAAALFTRVDLTRWWLYIVFGVVGLGIASLLNLLVFRSDSLDLLLSLGGVVLFSISTAASVQRIIKMERELASRLHNRAAIIGGAMLYTNFINLFMRLLSIYARLQKK